MKNYDWKTIYWYREKFLRKKKQNICKGRNDDENNNYELSDNVQRIKIL